MAATFVGIAVSQASASVVTGYFEFNSTTVNGNQATNTNSIGSAPEYVVSGNIGVDSTVISTSLTNTLTNQMGSGVTNFGVYQIVSASGLLYRFDSALSYTGYVNGAPNSNAATLGGLYYTDLSVATSGHGANVVSTVTGIGGATSYQAGDLYYVSLNGTVYNLSTFSLLAPGTYGGNDNEIAAGYDSLGNAVYGLSNQGWGFLDNSIIPNFDFTISWDNGAGSPTGGLDALDTQGSYITHVVYGNVYIPGSSLVDELVAANTTTESVPEPAALAVLGVGLVGLRFLRRRRANRPL